MKKIIGTLFIATIVVTLCAMTAFAQPGGGRGQGGPGGRGAGGPGGFGPGGPGGGGIGFLIRNEEIKKELGLSEEQVSKLEKIAEESRPQRGAGGPGGAGAGGDRPAPPSAEDLRKFREEFEKRAAESQAKVDQVLTPDQQEKLNVLQFQLSGGLESPFLSERSLAALKLTDEQKKQLKTINEEREAEGRAAFEKRGQVDWRNLSPEDREKLGRELQAENETRTKKFGDKIKTILTPEQKDKAEKLTAGAKDARDKLGIPAFGQGRRGGEGGGDRPNLDSWRPGQGAGDRGNQNRQQRRSFPQGEQ